MTLLVEQLYRGFGQALLEYVTVYQGVQRYAESTLSLSAPKFWRPSTAVLTGRRRYTETTSSPMNETSSLLTGQGEGRVESLGEKLCNSLPWIQDLPVHGGVGNGFSGESLL